MDEIIADAIESAMFSPNEYDRNGEPANIVDALFAISRALHRIAEAQESIAQHAWLGHQSVPPTEQE